VPASWDFLQWLINAQIARLHFGHETLGVHFKPGPSDGFRNDNLARPLDQRIAILENVMRPALALVGAEEIDEGDPSDLMYMTRFAVDYHKRGGKVPFYQVPQGALDEVAADLKGRSPLVITLREAKYWPERNSQLGEWVKFAQTCGDDVIFVRDTAKADEPIDGFETCPRASRDLLYRAALMQTARCNLFVANGPFILALYGQAPWLNFGALRPNLEYSPGQPRWWEKNMGVQVGKQFPWATQDQRVIWGGSDTLENINTAWSVVKSLQRAA
jgi:hypothetical protein